MRTYGKIESAFWQNKKIRPLSDGGKLLLIYIYTCPHGNSIGCFVLDPGYISADMKWPLERVTEHVTELVSKGFIEVDSETNLLRIVGWFDHNSIENDNIAKAAVKAILALPACPLMSSFLKELNEYGNKFINKFTNELRNAFPNAWPNQEQEQQQEPNTNKNNNQTGTRTGNGEGDTREEKSADKSAKQEKKIFENNFDAATAACCTITFRRMLTPSDEIVLKRWCKDYDIVEEVLPFLRERVKKHFDKNGTMPNNPLSYFDKGVAENVAKLRKATT